MYRIVTVYYYKKFSYAPREMERKRQNAGKTLEIKWIMVMTFFFCAETTHNELLISSILLTKHFYMIRPVFTTLLFHYYWKRRFLIMKLFEFPHHFWKPYDSCLLFLWNTHRNWIKADLFDYLLSIDSEEKKNKKIAQNNIVPPIQNY